MTKREVLRLLRIALIALYDNPISIRRLVDDAGVDTSQINFQGAAQGIWYSVITETERQEKIHALVGAVDPPYQNNQALQQAYQSYQQEQLKSRIILRLQEILVKLFPSQAEQRSVANKIFNPMDFTVLEGSAANVWSNILGMAHKLEIIDKLWDCPSVCHYAQQNKELSYCELLWLVSQANLPVKEWQGLYIASFPNTAIEKQPANSLEEAVDNLDKFIVQSDGTLPTLMFIERLASCVTNETIAGKLRHWVDEAPTRLNYRIDKDRIQRLRTELRNSQNSKNLAGGAYVLVAIYEHWNNRNQPISKYFSMQVIFWKNKDEVLCWYDAEEPMTLNAIPVKLYEILNNKIDSDISQLTIECFLPTELLSEAVDQWVVPLPRRAQRKYGWKYPIVVRSLERVQDQGKELKRTWKSRWSQFCEIDPKLSMDSVFWVYQRDNFHPEKLYKKLEQEKFYACVGLDFPLFDLECNPEMFYALLDAGIPIALWIRPCEHNVSIDKLKSKVLSDGVHDLPRLIQELRLDADDSVNRVGNYVTLLWDDPTRVPVQFTAPLQVA